MSIKSPIYKPLNPWGKGGFKKEGRRGGRKIKPSLFQSRIPPRGPSKGGDPGGKKRNKECSFPLCFSVYFVNNFAAGAGCMNGERESIGKKRKENEKRCSSLETSYRSPPQKKTKKGKKLGREGGKKGMFLKRTFVFEVNSSLTKRKKGEGLGEKKKKKPPPHKPSMLTSSRGEREILKRKGKRENTGEMKI